VAVMASVAVSPETDVSMKSTVPVTIGLDVEPLVTVPAADERVQPRHLGARLWRESEGGGGC
jgi:hypothetical protein